jgi:S-adenosylmethionine:tRNA ribosyltransferase-isomerase
MRVDLFDFELPEDRIALRPAVPRDSARLLVVGGDGRLADRCVSDLPVLLRPGDALVFNDTRVIPARLFGVRDRDGNAARIEATLHMRTGPDRWRAFLKPAKRVRAGERIRFPGRGDEGLARPLEALVAEKGEAGEALLVFDLAGGALDAALRSSGHVPLPPYIASRRADDARDRQDYQTVYARHEGAVAAPTAGLHFTHELMKRLENNGIYSHFVTLHVGAGTFLPVKADDTKDHAMHAESGRIDRATAAALNATRRAGGRIVAVGTTSLRLLESAAAADGTLDEWSGATDIFITPGYRFRCVDLLMTNFHLPRSTLFMLVSAFCGLETMRNAYAHAIEKGYRFYSYGDACLLHRSGADE